MSLYKVCDLVLDSGVPLPELSRVEDGLPDYAFQLLTTPAPDSDGAEWFHQWTSPNGETWLAFARLGPDYLLRFCELADFVVSVEGSYIRCFPKEDTPLETVRHLLLDQVIPLILSRQGKLVLHASAVATPRGAIAFLGATGRGKSTLAAAFARDGFPVLSDDCLPIEERNGVLFAKPSYSGLRLWPDSVSALFDGDAKLSGVAHYTTKRRLPGESNQLQFCSRPFPLKQAFLLEPIEEVSHDDPVRITRLPAREAFIEIVKCSYRMDVDDRDRLKEEFETFSRLATLPLFYRLVFPRDLSLLPLVRKTILESFAEAEG